jgi:hypothetical protein
MQVGVALRACAAEAKAAQRQATVSRLVARIGSPCLRHGVHGAPTGGGAGLGGPPCHAARRTGAGARFVAEIPLHFLGGRGDDADGRNRDLN